MGTPRSQRMILELIRRGPPWAAMPGRPNANVLWRAGDTEFRAGTRGYIDDGEDDDPELRPIDELMARGSKRRRDTFVERPPAPDTRRSASVPDFSALVYAAIEELQSENAAVTVPAILAKVRARHMRWTESTVENYFYSQFGPERRKTLGIISVRRGRTDDEQPKRTEAARRKSSCDTGGVRKVRARGTCATKLPCAATAPRSRFRTEFIKAVRSLGSGKGKPRLRAVAMRLGMAQAKLCTLLGQFEDLAAMVD